MNFRNLKKNYQDFCWIAEDFVKRMKKIIRSFDPNTEQNMPMLPPELTSLPIIQRARAYGSLVLGLGFLTAGAITWTFPIVLGIWAISLLITSSNPLIGIVVVPSILIFSYVSLYLARTNFSEGTRLWRFFKDFINKKRKE